MIDLIVVGLVWTAFLVAVATIDGAVAGEREYVALFFLSVLSLLGACALLLDFATTKTPVGVGGKTAHYQIEGATKGGLH